MSLSYADRVRFIELLDDVRCGRPLADNEGWFTQQLMNDEEAGRLYAESLWLSGALYWLLKGNQSPPFQLPDLAPTVRPASPVLGFLGSTGSFLRRPVFWSILLVGVLFTGYVVLVSWNMLGRDALDGRPQDLAGGSDLQPASSLESDAVATITASEDAVWSQDSEVPFNPRPQPGAKWTEPKSAVTAGEPLAITSGIVELQLKQGATLTIEGPAEWSIDGDNNATLKRGKLVARVPQQAIGFTLASPTANIVDLGTEFGVEVNNQGNAQVQVFAGAVQLKSANPFTTSKEFILPAGSARTTALAPDGKTVIVQEADWRPGHFARRRDVSRGLRRIPIFGAMASSEFGSFGSNNLINHSGLAGDTHTALTRLPDGAFTMWTSAVDRIKNEYVLFDLGRVCQLNHLKIWNYNDAHIHGARGAAQVDICIAQRSQGDPISTPELWERIVVDRALQPAPGNDSYDTPDVIPLDDVEARYVGIVIDDWIRPKAGSEPNFYRCVGLSEVQVFGTPTNSQLKVQD